MGRTRGWDQQEVLDSAMAVFRARGYEGTSLRDLVQATGLHPGSVYQAYGSKAGLFDAVLGAYNERVVRARIERYLVGGDDPISGLLALFASTYEHVPGPDPGCLVTNSAVESPLLSGAARHGVAAGLDALRDGFRDALLRARADGRIAEGAPVDRLADQLLALYQGILVLVRFGSDRASLEAATQAVRSIVGPVNEIKEQP